MKKKLLSLALVFVMALTLLPTAALATDGNDDGTNPPVVECTEHVYVDGVCTNCGADEPVPPSNDVPRDTTGPDATTPGTTTGPDATTPGTTTGPDTTTHVHQWSNWTKVDDKQCKRTCSATDCTSTNNEEIANHVASSDWTTTDSEHYKTCTHCGTELEKAAHSYTNGKCTVCQKDDPNYTPPIQAGKHSLTLVPEKAATCTTPGNNPYYTCSICDDLFSDPVNLITIKKSDIVIAATGHERPATESGYNRDITGQHSYHCPSCDKDIVEDHVFVDGLCKYCGIERSTNPGSYVSISSVRLYSYSVSVTWSSNADSGTAFDLYLDGSFYGTVHPSKSGGYFSYTMDFSRYLGDPYYNVEVRLSSDSSVRDDETVRNRYDYDYDYDYWYDHRYPNGTPGTNSYGIPHASQVNGRYSASEAIRILRNKNQNSLQNDLMSNSSALDSYERLERAVKDANHVSVNVSTDRGVPSAIRAGGGVQITGAAFNASSTNSTVRLVVGTPSVSRYVGRGYQFSMSLTGVGNDSSLDVPVVVSMPLPSDISASYVKVLHYHNSNVPTVITPKVSGSRISFPLTGFSDFVVTDSGVPNYTYVSDGYGGYYVPVGNVPRQSLLEQHVAIVAPILASMPPSGYVFDDVAPGHWAAAAIRWARDGGMMSGYYDGTFRPYAATTRQELWMVLARLAGARPADMEAARIWAVNAGISDGRNPYSPLSRQQMISMLYRYAQYLGRDISGQVPLRNYRDNAAVSGYARNAMAWALDQGILTSDADGFLFPQNIATRADFAVYLYRFVN